MTKLKHYLVAAALAVAFLAATPLSFAQTPPGLPPAPYNTPQANGALISSTPTQNYVLKNTLVGVGTVNSGLLNMYGYRGIVCSIAQSADSGSPSVSISLQQYDSATQTYLTLLTSGTSFSGATAAQALNLPTVVELYPGVQTSTLPTGMTAISLHAPRFMRIQQVTSSALFGGAHTSYVGCDLLV